MPGISSSTSGRSFNARVSAQIRRWAGKSSSPGASIRNVLLPIIEIFGRPRWAGVRWGVFSGRLLIDVTIMFRS